MVQKFRLNTLLDTIIMMLLKLPQMIGYVKSFENNMTMSFKISDEQLLKKVQSNMEKS